MRFIIKIESWTRKRWGSSTKSWGALILVIYIKAILHLHKYYICNIYEYYMHIIFKLWLYYRKNILVLNITRSDSIPKMLSQYDDLQWQCNSVFMPFSLQILMCFQMGKYDSFIIGITLLYLYLKFDND